MVAGTDMDIMKPPTVWLDGGACYRKNPGDVDEGAAADIDGAAFTGKEGKQIINIQIVRFIYDVFRRHHG